MYELNIYMGIICYNNEEWWKIWKGIDLSAKNWHDEFIKCWPKHSKLSKIYTLMGCLWPIDQNI